MPVAMTGDNYTAENSNIPLIEARKNRPFESELMKLSYVTLGTLKYWNVLTLSN